VLFFYLIKNAMGHVVLFFHRLMLLSLLLQFNSIIGTDIWNRISVIIQRRCRLRWRKKTRGRRRLGCHRKWMMMMILVLPNSSVAMVLGLLPVGGKNQRMTVLMLMLLLIVLGLILSLSWAMTIFS